MYNSGFNLLKMNRFRIALILLFFSIGIVHAQQQPPVTLVQLSGLVVTADSTQGLPFVSIRIKNSSKGTLTDEQGFFSFVIKKTDTVVFTSVGYKTVEFILPQNLSAVKHTIMQSLVEDTVYLEQAVIRSYPKPDEFNYYFVKANIPDPYYDASARNLRKKTLETISLSMSMDGSESQRYAARQQAYSYYYNGQLPPQRIFDPIAWSQFFKAWQQGAYKKKN